jgi:HK97 family phage prohead protease
VKLETKSFGVADLKATGPASGGSFEAIVAAFGNVDSGGDRMIPGAFEKTLQPPPEGRGYPPIVWSHLWGVVPIGSTANAEEVQGYKTSKGEEVDGLLIGGDLFVDEHQTAKEVYTAMSRKGGDGLPVLRDFSFGYKATEQLTAKDDGFKAESSNHVRDLIAVDLFEVGPTLVGMNELAGLGDVKSALGGLSLKRLLEELKLGARNSSSDKAMLQEIHDLSVELGIDCTAKAARAPAPQGLVTAAVFKAIGASTKGYDDIDSYAIYLLSSMIEWGAQFIVGEADDADVGRMRTLLLELAAMLADEIAEVEGDTAPIVDAIEEASRRRDGHETKTAPVHDPAISELLFAFPR